MYVFYQITERVQVILLDGKIIVGELATVDHFSNLVLRDAVERIVVGKNFGDIMRGIFIIRGENIVLVGEVVSLECVYACTRFCGVDRMFCL